MKHSHNSFCLIMFSGRSSMEPWNSVLPSAQLIEKGEIEGFLIHLYMVLICFRNWLYTHFIWFFSLAWCNVHLAPSDCSAGGPRVLKIFVRTRIHCKYSKGFREPSRILFKKKLFLLLILRGDIKFFFSRVTLSTGETSFRLCWTAGKRYNRKQ